MNKIELLAPAGNFNCLAAAVQSGADAVYFAGKKFGARSFADNFDLEEIKRAIDYCHLRGVKTHITVNTAYNDNEIDDVIDFIKFVYSEGADALIVSDVGLASVVRKNFPGIELHASTQMTIHNLDGVKFAEKLGFNRVVLSRELSFEDISYITKNSAAEIEVFAHGALCMSYSGQCLLSSMIGGRSGNRGSCAQPCRLPFSADGKEKRFLLSLKDLSLAEHIDALKGAGVSSLKIEGRMKGTAYVSAVVGIYRKYIDNGLKINNEDKEILNGIFFRGGLTDGYFLGIKNKKMFDFNKPDNPYLKQSKEFNKIYGKDYINEENKKIDINLKFEGTLGEKPFAKVYKDGVSYEYKHNNTLEKAINNIATKEMISTQLSKTGGTPFQVQGIDVSVSDNVFLSKGEINEIRRNILDGFEKNYIQSFKRNTKDICVYPEIDKKDFKTGFSAYISLKEQLDAICGYDFERIYVPFDIAVNNPDICEKIKKDKLVVTLPEISTDKEKIYIEEGIKQLDYVGVKRVLINNYGQINYGDKFDIILSHRFNIWNSKSINLLNEFKPISVFLSPELNLKTINKLKKFCQCEIIAYGKIPVMITENCIIKNMDKCPCDKDKFYYITDRMNVKFPVKSTGKYCRSIMYNSAPLYLADKITDKCFDGVVKCLYFTTEDKEMCKKICSDYFSGCSDNIPEIYTRGHLYK